MSSRRSVIHYPRTRKPLLVAGILFLLLVPAALLAARHPTPAQADWFDNNWGFRTRINIANSGAAKTNFQVQIATDTATPIYAGKMISNCNDVRFTDNQGKLLTYWLETGTCNTATTKFWVRVPSIPTTGTYIYMYYGNSNATAGKTQTGTKGYPGLSCKSILNAGDGSTSGQYWIDPTNGDFSDEFQAYCDQTNDSGGWMLVTQSMISSEANATISATKTVGTNNGLVYTMTPASSGCINPVMSSVVLFQDIIPWTQIKADYRYTGGNSCWAIFGNNTYSTSANITPYSAGTDTIRNQVKMGGSNGDNYDGTNFRCDNTTTNFWHSNQGLATVRSAQVILRRNSMSSLAGLGTGITCTAVGNYPWSYSNIYLRENTMQSTDITISLSNTEETGGGPLAYWKFDDGYGTTLHDSSKNRYDGTISGATWKDTSDCLSGRCLYFDGSSNDYINVGASSRYGATATQGAYTVEAWVKVDNPSRYNVISRYIGGGDYISAGQPGTSKVYSMVHDATNNVNYWPGSNGTVTANTWTQISYVFSTGNYVKIYINGQLDNTINNSNLAFFNYNSIAYLGIGVDANTYFHGFMDEVKIYAYERSAAQIKADYLSVKDQSSNGAAISIGASSVVSPLTTGLGGYWKMDEATWSGTTADVLDFSGNNATGTAQGVTGGAAYPTIGKYGNSGFFDGVDDYVDIPSTNSLNTTNQLTISAWIKPTSLAANRIILGKWNQTTNQRSYMIQLQTNGRMYLYTSTVGSDAITAGTGSTPITTNTWTHLVVTKSGTTVRYFLNGSPVVTETLSSATVYSGTSNFRIGRDYNGGAGSPYSGYLDDVRVYNRALSPGEIQALYNYEPAPLMYWNMDEHTGTSINDITGNGYNSTSFTGSPTWTQGKYGSALSFGGTNQSVNFGNVGGITGNLSVSAWVKWNQFKNYGIVVQRGSGGATANSNYSIWSYSDHLGCVIADGSSSVATTYYTLPSTGTWHHIECVADGTNLIMYLDGIKVASQTQTVTPTSTGNALTISEPTYTIDGSVDEVKVYNYARTSTQVTEDMNGGHPIGGSPVGSQAIYYKFNEGYGTTLNNAVSTNYTGTMYNNVTWENDGKFGKSLRFDGTTAQIAVGGSNNFFKYQGGDMALSLWVKPDASDNGGYLISKPWNGSGQYNYSIFSGGGATPSFTFSLLGATSYSLASNKTVTAGTWHYVAVTLEGSTGLVKFYIDGVLTNSGTNTITNWTPSSGDSNLKIAIGCIYPYESNNCAGGNTVNDFMGSLDEIKIYNSTLTANQIAQDYNAGASLNFGTGYASDSASLSDGTGNPPVLYWNLEEHTGSTVNDKSGNNNTGTWGGTLGSQWATGKIGAGGNLNGSDNQIVTTATPTPATSGTLETWIYPDSSMVPPASSYPSLIKYTGDPGLYIQSGTGKPYIQVTISGVGQACVSSTALTANVWQHVVGTYNLSGGNTILNVYLNGVPVCNATFAGTITQTAGVISLSSASLRYKGKIDEIKIFDYARTPAQIAYDYNRGAPVGWWKFDECSGGTFNDASGNNHPATWLGGTTIGTCTTASTAWGNGATGKYNSSMAFSSANSDYARAAAGTYSSFGTGNFAVSAWFKTTTAGAQKCIASIAGSSTGWRFGVSSGKPYYLYGDGTHFHEGNLGTTNVNDNNWHHMVINYTNASQVEGFVDGKSVGTASVSDVTGSASTNSFLYIGSMITTTNVFDGQVDDLRIYNYNLSSTQVKNLYNGGAAVKYGPLTGTP